MGYYTSTCAVENLKLTTTQKWGFNSLKGFVKNMKLNKAKYKAALQGSSLGSGLKEACLKKITKLIRKSFGRNL